MIHAGSRHKPQEPTNHSTWSSFVFQATQSLAKGEYLLVAPWRNIHIPLYKGGHTPLYEGILACPKSIQNSTLGQRPILANFSFPFSTKVSSFSTKVSSLFLLYEGLPVGLLFPSLRRSFLFLLLYEGLDTGSEKISCGPKFFHGIIPSYPSARHHPSTG
jgi:hypothetical protein